MSELFDVVIVGSGAGGGMAAYMLTAGGARVAVVEAGNHNFDRDIRHHQWPWELPLRNSYTPDPVQVRLTTKEEVVGKGIQERVTIFDGSAHNTYHTNHFFVKIRDWRYTHPEDMPYRWVRVRSIGGKTNCWAGGANRWGPLEWKPYSYDGFGVDWPISYEEMAPWYSKTEKLMGISGERTGKMTALPDGEFQPPPASDCLCTIMRGPIARAGYTVVREARAAITRPLNGRPSCHYCGRCGHGCDSGSKFTSVGALLPPATATGRMTMFTNAIVREVNLDRQGRASGVTYVDRYTHQENTVRGRYVVLSASAIETARILLNSKSSLFPNGLANSSGQVGRNLVEDTKGFVTAYLPQLEGRAVTNEDSYDGSLLIHPFVNVDERTRSKDFLRRYLIYVSGGFTMSPGDRGDLPPFGTERKAATSREYGSDFTIMGAGCGLEDPNNFVDIDPEVKDAWGIPAVRIHLKFGPNQEAMIRHMVERATEMIESAGGKVLTRPASPSVPGSQIHEQGTCRMGDDPKKSVTNRWGQSHDVPNLILADGSIHCTSGITNPTLTILSLTMRNISHLVEEVRMGSV
jgi:choline dehydrogenase-like flavoprotein